MKILVTGAKGFVGRNLVENLKCIKEGKNRTRPNLQIEEIFEYDRDSTKEELSKFCKEADFVFHLAGVNRPKEEEEFMEGNFGFSSELLEELKRWKNFCPVMFSSSIQASLEGRFKDSPYGKSKLAGENLFSHYGRETGSKVMIYRFPNLFGKWCKPNYNSVVATFCHNTAHNLSIRVNDGNTELSLFYIDDAVESLLDALEGKEDYENGFVKLKNIHRVKLSEIVDLLEKFGRQPESLMMPAIPKGSFEKKLYSTYLSYLPKEKIKFPLRMNTDERGSFTEVLKTASYGQFSVNISKPGTTKGEHWHNTKWEFFIVVSGRALIQERKIGTDEILEFMVSGEKMEAVHMLPGYTHNIINLSETEDLVTLMWANEEFEQERPDTFFEKVKV